MPSENCFELSERGSNLDSSYLEKYCLQRWLTEESITEKREREGRKYGITDLMMWRTTLNTLERRSVVTNNLEKTVHQNPVFGLNITSMTSAISINFLDCDCLHIGNFAYLENWLIWIINAFRLVQHFGLKQHYTQRQTVVALTVIRFLLFSLYIL